MISADCLIVLRNRDVATSTGGPVLNLSTEPARHLSMDRLSTPEVGFASQHRFASKQESCQMP